MTIAVMDLRAEAAAEMRRLSRARSMVRDGDERALAQLEADATWIATSRRARRALGRRVCLLWRAAFEDASGRVVASRLLPIVIDLGPDVEPGRPRRAWIRSLLQQIDAPARARIDGECDAWRREVARVAGAFTAARLARERDIAASQPSASRRPEQAGLFDRRAEREHQDRIAAAAECGQAVRDRLRVASGGGAIALVPPRLLLVLVP